MRWLLANRTLATSYRPDTALCRLRYLTFRRATPSFLSLAALHNVRQKQPKLPSKTKQSSRAQRGTKDVEASGSAAAHGKARGKPKDKHVVKARSTPDRNEKSARTKSAKTKSTKTTSARTNTQGSRSHEPVELEYSESRLLRTLRVPTHKDLPRMPKHALKQPFDALKSAIGFLRGEVSKETGRMSHPESNKNYFRTIMTVRLPEREELVALGDAESSGPQATKAASLHILAKLHDAGLLALPWAPATLTSQEVKNEKTGILDVFSYAARYGCIPKLQSKRHRRYHIVDIEMPEHDIKVSVSAIGSLSHAEAAAALEFKRQAELYHLKKGTDSLVVKDSTVLNATNATDFFKFCKDCGEEVGQVKIQTTAEPGDSYAIQAMLDGVEVGPRVVVASGGKKSAQNIGYLVAALSAADKKPELLKEFNKALRASNGKYLPKLSPADLTITAKSLQEMRMLHNFASRYRTKEDASDDIASGQAARQTGRRDALFEDELAEKSAKLRAKLDQYRTRADLEGLRQVRSELPMTQYAPQVREIVQNNIYCVIIGATGSGKTTQVPQILLDQAIENGNGASCNIICTQPRRIAATSVARRVAVERAEKLQDTVGYQVRFDTKLPKPGGSIVYCTTGVLLQQLQHAPDEVYDNTSHLVIDEVHERDIIIDFLLIMLKKTMAARISQGKKVPHVILMSATIDAELFSAYFKDSLPLDEPTDCPTLSVPGRTFPVTERYLDDILQELEATYDQKEMRLLSHDKQTAQYLEIEKSGLENNPVDPDSAAQEFVIDWKNKARTTGDDDALVDNKNDALVPLGLAATTIAHIVETTETGAILVFVPGLDEITSLDKMLRYDSPLGVDFNDSQRFQVFMLHSSIPDSQKTVFDRLPDGCRKIILSTNIAETSVTIPDVQYVVDTGKSREKRYDQMRRITALQCTWVSKSNAKQRAGRAGRVQNGNYYALFTRSRRESMRAIGLPELLRSDLQETCLDVKTQAFKMPVRTFLAGAIEPPSLAAVDTALRDLTTLGAITEEEELTPLGRLLASLPVHPSLGKMIVLGVIFRCLDPMIILGAAAHERPLFASPPEKRKELDVVKKRLAGTSKSDHIMLLRAFNLARQASTSRSPQEAFAVFNDNFIHRGAFKSIDATARQIEEILQQSGLIQISSGYETGPRYGGEALNENSDSEAVIKALLFAGMYPNIAMPIREPMYRTRSEKYTFVHQTSVNNASSLNTNRVLTYTSLALSADGGRMNLRDTTVGSPLMALLLAGQLSSAGPILEVDGWLRFYTKVMTPSGSIVRHNGRTIASEVAAFRKTLDLMLEAAFNNLLKGKSFANDLLREKLADGLARILDWEAGRPLRSASSYYHAMGSDDGGMDRTYQRRLPRSFGIPERRSESRQGSRGRLDSRTERAGHRSVSGFDRARDRGSWGSDRRTRDRSAPSGGRSQRW